MHRQNVLAIVLISVILVAVVSAGYAKGIGPLGVVSLGMQSLMRGTQQGLTTSIAAADQTSAAPELASGSWINSQPLTLKQLQGRVVLIEFWTFACYNCRNTLPFVKRWHQRYSDNGLTIIGVHSPELEEESNFENVSREVASLGITYPVVTDNDFTNWRAYDVRAWPTVFILDKHGKIRWKHVGEGAYAEAERTIQRLLAE